MKKAAVSDHVPESPLRNSLDTPRPVRSRSAGLIGLPSRLGIYLGFVSCSIWFVFVFCWFFGYRKYHPFATRSSHDMMYPYPILPGLPFITLAMTH
jgi:hypothetical protein